MSYDRAHDLITNARAAEKLVNFPTIPSRESHVRVLQSGDVRAERNGKGYKYQLGNLPSVEIDSAEVDRWRKFKKTSAPLLIPVCPWR